jgi:hypothetical protein
MDKMIESAKEIMIISGEGEVGTTEKYNGKKTLRALKLRLSKELCEGDRWACAEIDGYRYNYVDGELVPRY